MVKSNSKRTLDLFVSCGPGLEPLLKEELESLGYDKIEIAYRGVYLTADNFFDAIFRVNYCSRIATRLLLPLKRFHCNEPRDLYQNAEGIPWEDFIPKGKTIAIDANVRHPLLKNSLYAAQVVKDAICDRLKSLRGERPSVDTITPDVQLNLFIQERTATISFDTSCAALHKRGYRQAGGEAPLQEVLAAAILLLSGWKGEGPLCDLFCGTGTFLAEAALIATDTAPGFLRQKWGFFYLPDFSQKEWLKVKAEIDARRRPLPAGLITGVDKDEGAIRATYTNLRACGFAEKIELVRSDFESFVPKIAPELTVANPPHGGRLGSLESLKPLYAALGSWLREFSARPGRSFILLAHTELAKALSLGAGKKQKFVSGGETKYLCQFDFRPRERQ